MSNDEERTDEAVQKNNYAEWSDAMLATAMYCEIEDLADLNSMLIAIEEAAQEIIKTRTEDLEAIKAEREKRKEA